MKLSWKQIRFFGFTITLPLVVILAEKIEADRVELFRQYRAEMAECPHCHKFHRGHYHLSLIEHLVDDHDMESMHVINIVEDLVRKTLQVRKAKSEARDASN